jgi:SAM-dependent methyltransferase
MNRIQHFSQEAERKLLQSEASQVATAGNKLDSYKNTAERDASTLYLKTSVLNIFLGKAIASWNQQGNNRPFTLLDLGCGNGHNVRAMIRELRQTLSFSAPIKIIFCDIFSELLEEASSRMDALVSHDKELSYELVQLDLSNPTELSLFSEKYRNAVDFAFSIKFLHNVPIKINRRIAAKLSAILRPKAFLVVQFYLETHFLLRLERTLRFMVGSGYGNSVPLDLWVACRNLKAKGLLAVYEVESRSLSKDKGINHFFRHSSERYFQKIADH